ncbi:hypothetical protein SAMN05192558_113127 [Actinokineospora alba]|uniref:Uncharacterized protein n=1 Tax=Actinokineospora alba TaxID=504798 RepID=A0A1H0V9Y1_9PSEU|nr:hypothetical protein [Actinokineospora alba]TDP65574.1 hypothetical protein C8E96_1060 [Actinokineospora alba]SDH65799.1 hypothetical protein SAMN05421871_101881 [Actinokineospora alba]SDP75250.1 hypothetical protein SAMN05192558_113127 [Actinokineospora alba]
MKKRIKKVQGRFRPGSCLVDRLLMEVYLELRVSPPAAPTSALLDGSALERRERREARRALDAVVRALPVRRVVSDLEAA